ncbi:MAG: immunoglobulin domain-containing protein, partial [Sedimentisphaerales bacterium]|nr:immunoglobulin domain-containing protein [Sedimentisphaerales bacterium]
NDDHRNADTIGGTSANIELRNYGTSRAKAILLRFDVARLYGLDLNNAQISITTTSAARSRTMNVYGLTDGADDLWDEATLSYNSAPGLVDNPGPDYTVDGMNMIEGSWSLLGTFNTTQNTTSTQVHTGTIAGLADFIAADKNGLITLLIYPASSENLSYYTLTKEDSANNAPGLTFPNSKGAKAVSPDFGDLVLPDLSELCWTNPEPNAANGVITSDIYLGTAEPNLATPNYGLTLLESNYNGTCYSLSGVTLTEGTWYWRIDSHDSSFASTYHSPFIKFEVTAAPIIDVQPVSTSAKAGTNATFSVTVTSQSTPHFNWYFSTDNISDPANDTTVGTDSAFLTLPEVNASDRGYYYCIVSNNSGSSSAVTSSVVKLDVYREIAHWTFDELIDGVFADISGEGHIATPVSEPNFVMGAKGMAIDTSAGQICSAGTWIPSEETGKFSVALWVNWNGSNGAGQGIFAKGNAYAADSEMYHLSISAAGTLHANSYGLKTAYGYSAPSVGNWELIVLTFNGSVADIYQLRASDVHVLTVSNGTAFTLGSKTDSDIVIGASTLTGTDFFNGLIDDVVIYNYDLELKDMIDLYNQSLNGNFCYLDYDSSDYVLDVNNNCIIDLADFAALAQSWLACGLYPNCPQ